MIDREHINDSWECPEDDCDKGGMTSAEFRDHGIEEHPEESPFTEFFPEYNVCNVGPSSVYMKAETESGPYYMAWDDRKEVERMHPWELKRHDWELIDREDTPFPEFEE